MNPLKKAAAAVSRSVVPHLFYHRANQGKH
jgi:hypothetical protein